MKRLLKKTMLALSCFILGIAFVISCGQQTNSGLLDIDSPGALAQGALAYARDIIFEPDNTSLPFSADNVQLAIEALVELVDGLGNAIDDLTERMTQLEDGIGTGDGGGGTGSLVLGCPSDMKRVADFCVEKNKSASSQFDLAVNSCGDRDRRLCYAQELYAYCQNTTVIDFNNNQWEWSGSMFGEEAVELMLYNSNCDNTNDDGDFRDGSREYRCCTNLQLISLE